MQSIIIPVDFTKRSRQAVDYFASLYSTIPVRVILIHAHSTLKSSEFLISIEDIIEKDIRSKLENEGRYLKEKMAPNNLEIIYACERNDIITAISNASVKYLADLLIIGSDGEESWNDITFKEEGKTMNIVKELSIPSLIIPNNEDVEKPKNILFATLIGGIHQSKEIEPLIELVKTSGAHLDVLSVGPEKASSKLMDRGLKKTVDGYIDQLDFDTYTLGESDTFKAINEFSKNHDNDMICIIIRKHSVLDKLLRPSISKKVLLNGARPILALKHINER